MLGESYGVFEVGSCSSFVCLIDFDSSEFGLFNRTDSTEMSSGSKGSTNLMRSVETVGSSSSYRRSTRDRKERIESRDESRAAEGRMARWKMERTITDEQYRGKGTQR